MTDAATLTPRVLPGSADRAALESDGVRYMIDSVDTGGRFAMVELLFPPHTLVAPVHRHSREDEFSYVTRGRITAMLGDDVVTAGPGDLIVRPRGQWHTFWNAGDEPAACLDIDSPGGLEQMLREETASGAALDPDAMVALAARYGCEVDLDATEQLVARRGLAFM